MLRVAVRDKVLQKQLISRDTLDGLNKQSSDILSVRFLGTFLRSKLRQPEVGRTQEVPSRVVYLEKLSELRHLLLQTSDVSDGLVVLGNVLGVRFQKCSLYRE
jgi:hypothetical protein